ncbi:unnamed protein product [Euphydryas editha]|uniref:Uncharacterized protein n=1 Tax=Euphydryas editha TaxID=104508 RepID=A0AAU9UYJ6_EUPED|nr:unnamed protein product [Euphydryas editha]
MYANDIVTLWSRITGMGSVHIELQRISEEDQSPLHEVPWVRPRQEVLSRDNGWMQPLWWPAPKSKVCGVGRRRSAFVKELLEGEARPA